MDTLRGLVNIPTEALDTTRNIREDLGDLSELTSSVADLGVVTPITVYEPTAGRWVVLAGHRRVEAARRAGLASVPALSLGASPPDEDRLVVALTENLLREDLNPLDEAAVYEQLAELRGWGSRPIAAALHVSPRRVSRRRALLTLPPAVQAKIRARDISMEHGYKLARLVKAGADAAHITGLANKPPAAASQDLRRRKQRRAVADETRRLQEAGVTVVAAKDLPYKRTLVSLDIDAQAHSHLRCHVVAVHPRRNASPYVEPGCADPDRHEQLPDYTPEEDAADTAAFRARFAQQQARWDARSVDFGRRLAADDADTLIWEALAVSAHLILGVPPPDDPLLDTFDPDERDPVACPPAAIRSASSHHLAAAILRHHLERQQRKNVWFGPAGESANAILKRVEERVGPLGA